MANTVKLGRVNMPRLLRQMRHRTSQVRDLVFVRDEVFQKDTKTTKTGGTLAGPPVSFGYETTGTATRDGTAANTSWHVNTPELVLPGFKCLQSPIMSRSGTLERGGHRITGSCSFYAPSLDYILSLNNFSETKQFNELETYDKLYDMERIIEKIDDYSATNTSHTIREFPDETAGYQIDRLQFKIKSGTTLTKITLKGNEGGSTKTLTWGGTLALSRHADHEPDHSHEWLTIDIPLRDIKVNGQNGYTGVSDKTSIYKDGVRVELTAAVEATTTLIDIDKLHGAPTYDLLGLVLTTSSGLVELKDIYLYKEAEWRIDAIKEFRDEYMAIGAVRIRGDRGSRRRTYG